MQVPRRIPLVPQHLLRQFAVQWSQIQESIEKEIKRSEAP